MADVLCSQNRGSGKQNLEPRIAKSEPWCRTMTVEIMKQNLWPLTVESEQLGAGTATSELRNQNREARTMTTGTVSN